MRENTLYGFEHHVSQSSEASWTLNEPCWCNCHQRSPIMDLSCGNSTVTSSADKINEYIKAHSLQEQAQLCLCRIEPDCLTEAVEQKIIFLVI